MSNTPQASAKPPKPDSEVEESTVQWEHHVRWIAPASAGILIVATAFLWWQSNLSDQRLEVYQAFSQATTPAALEQVAYAWPDEPEAPLALMQAGALYFDEGNYEAARIAYTTVTEEYPGYPLVDGAAFGMAITAEELGDLESAMQGYRGFEEGDVLYPRALLGVARILERQGKLDQAKEQYEDVIERFENTPSSSLAQTLLRGVEMRLRMQATAKSPASEESEPEMPSSPEEGSTEATEDVSPDA